MSPDCSYLYLGGNMISVQGRKTLSPYPGLNEFINMGKDESMGAQKLIVLLENNRSHQVTLPIRESMALPRQSLYVKTQSKYIDIKIKKVQCNVELNSSSNNSLHYDRMNLKFVQFLKVFLNGRCNLSSMKLAQALKLQIVEGLQFEVTKYSDSFKLIKDVEACLPPSLCKFGITYDEESVCRLTEDESLKAQADHTLKSWVNTHPKMEISVQDSNNDSQSRMYYSPIMHSSYQGIQPNTEASH